MAVFNNILAGASGATGAEAAAFQIDRSLRFNSNDTAYLSRTPSSAGNGRTWTLSTWIKTSSNGTILCNGVAGSGDNGIYVQFYSNVLNVGTWTSSWQWNLITDRVFRDPSAWFHLVVSVDTTQATASNRVKIYINGVQETSFSTENYPSQNYDTLVNNTALHAIGRYGNLASGYLDGYLAEVHFIDGQALTADDFGEEDDFGVWQPKEFTGDHNVTSGTVYSSSSSGMSNPESMFDGDTSTSPSLTADDTVYTMLTGVSIACSSSLRINANANDFQVSVNGGAYTSATSVNSTWLSLSVPSGNTLTSLTFKDGAGGGYGVRALEVDGTVLVDGTVGVNGFYLDFSDNSSNAALGTDSSGNDNDWTVNNLTAVVVPVDVGGNPTVSSSDKPFTTGFSVAFDGDDKMRMEGPGTVSGDFTWECWVKFTGTPDGRFFSAAENENGTEYSLMRFYNGNLNVYSGDGDGYEANTYTGTVSANTWHHIAMVRSGDTVSHYLDGSRWDTNTFSNSFEITTLVLAHGYGSEYFTGSISNARFVNGQALYSGTSYTVPTATLTTTSQSATASNVTTLVAHKTSLTANDGTKIEILNSSSDIDSMIDTPTDYTSSSSNNGGNYAVLNPLANSKFQGRSLADGNLDFTGTRPESSGYPQAFSTIGMSSGKFYCEALVMDSTDTNGVYVGVCDKQMTTTEVSVSSTYPGGPGGSAYGAHGKMEQDSSVISTGNGTYTGGDIIGIAYDADDGKLYFSKNGSFVNSADPANGTSPNLSSITGEQFFVFGGYGARGLIVNFGQRPFNTDPPSGFKSLCTQNLDDPLIEDPSTLFDAVLYDGTGSSQTVGSLNFSPDLAWMKQRSGSRDHMIHDTVRGDNNALYPSQTYAEASTSGVTFGSTGFTLGTDSHVNQSSNTYVAWAWDAGSSNTSISAGDSNSSVYNETLDISPNITTTNITFGANQGLDKWFNGDKSDKMEPAGSGSLDFTDISGLQNFSGTLQFAVTAYNPGSNLKFVINASSDNLTFQANTFPSSGAFPSTFVTIDVDSLETLDFTSVSGESVQFWGMYLDGKLLVDSSQTPPNVPSIASTARANQSAGFSIVSYTGNSTAGTTIGHGLNAQPSFILLKNRDRGTNGHWAVGHIEANTFVDGALTLNTTNAQGSGYTGFFGANPTSSFFTVNNNYESNYASEDYIAYCWAPVEGFSSFGSYEGNGSSDGPFVYTGFRPKFVLLRNKSRAENWVIYDDFRSDFNAYLAPNTDGAEGSFTRPVIALSNGFQLGDTRQLHNRDGDDYIFAAWAEHPFKTARAR